MTFDTPSSPGPDDDERELLLGFVRWQREQVAATSRGSPTTSCDGNQTAA